jgi:phosphate uptake regulator
MLILLRILPEVERNGDLAEHIARRAARGLGSEMSPRPGLIERMGEVASTIWREATDVIIDGKPRRRRHRRHRRRTRRPARLADGRTDLGIDERARRGRSRA